MKHPTDTRGVTTKSHVRAIRLLAEYDVWFSPDREYERGLFQSLADYRPDLVECDPGRQSDYFRLTPAGREVAKEMGL